MTLLHTGFLGEAWSCFFGDLDVEAFAARLLINSQRKPQNTEDEDYSSQATDHVVIAADVVSKMTYQKGP